MGEVSDSFDTPPTDTLKLPGALLFPAGASCCRIVAAARAAIGFAALAFAAAQADSDTVVVDQFVPQAE